MPFDEFSENQRLTDPKEWLRKSVSFPIDDTTCSQLDNRRKSMKSLIDTYKVIQSSFVVIFF